MAAVVPEDYEERVAAWRAENSRRVGVLGHVTVWLGLGSVYGLVLAVSRGWLWLGLLVGLVILRLVASWTEEV